MKSINIGLNGFGRIGRAFTRISSKKKNINIVAINTGSTKPDMLAYLLKYDSVYRRFSGDVKAHKDGISIDGKRIPSMNIRDPQDIPWSKYKTDIVVDCTGIFKTREDLKKHLRGTVKKVILTAPAKDESIPYVVLGVNDKTIDFAKEEIVSNASCTTNCAAPMFKIINDNLSITSGFLTTVHAYTSTQQILDNSSKDYTRARAANLSIIPTTTGAAKAVGKVITELDGKLDGMALRVPTPVGSFTDISCVVRNATDHVKINKLFEKASQTTLKNILQYEQTPLVSSDYLGSPYSCIFDPNYTKVLGGTLVKIFGWYDNEWGYSSRLVDLAEKLALHI